MSQRRLALNLNIKWETVARKLKFLGEQSRLKNHRFRKEYCDVTEMQFDDMETIEHTKLKPLSITIAVEKKTRVILGFEVSRMPAKGLLAKKSLRKYGRREDGRAAARDRLFRRVNHQIKSGALIESDDNPHYPVDVRRFFPNSVHKTYLGGRGSSTGQGELKKLRHDPLFSFNHTAAMIRYSVNRFIRKTWCTTKKIQPLIDHLEVYAHYHNHTLLDLN